MAGETILIVEDNPVNRKLLLIILKRHGYNLLTAVDGEEALQIANRNLPDLIIMDLQLPKLNGYEVTKALRDNPDTTHIPVIALTAHAMDEEQKRAEEIGFQRYITKPINTRTFPEQIHLLLHPVDV